MGKVFDGCFSVFAWINNAFWGTLFIVGGVYFMFWQGNFWFGVMGIGIGIYFFWTKSWTRKTLEVISGEDPDEAAAPAPTGPAKAVAVPTPSGSVSQRKTWIKNGFMAASLLFLVLGASGLNADEESIGASVIVCGGLALASFFIYARITVHRATEDDLPALPWGEMFVAVLTAAFSPNTRHVSYSTPEGAAAAAQRAAHPIAAAAPAPAVPVPRGSVTMHKVRIRQALLVAGVLLMLLGANDMKQSLAGFFVVALIYAGPTLALFWAASRIRFDRAVEDATPAVSWAASLRTVFHEVFDFSSPPGSQTPPVAAPAVSPAPPSVAAAGAEAAPVPVSTEAAPSVPGASPITPAVDVVRRNPKVLIVGVGAVLAVAIVFYGGSAIGRRFFGPAAGTGLESRVAAATPHDSPDTVLTMVESVSEGDPRSVQLKEIDNEGSHDRFTIALEDTYYYSIDGEETDLETFFEYAKANISAECDIDYTSEGIFGLGMVGGGDVEAPVQSEDAATPGDLPTTDAAPEASEGDVALSELDSHARVMIDLTAQARSDGAGRVLEIRFIPAQSDSSGMVAFATTDAPNEWYQLDPSELGDCFVDKRSVAAEQFQDAIASGAVYGMISFNTDGVTEVRASTDPSGPTDGY